MDAAATRSSSRKPWVARSARTSGRANPAGDGNVGILSAQSREAAPAVMSPSAREFPCSAGKGNDSASSSTASRAAAEAAPRLDRDDRARTTPCARHFARDEDSTGPDARCPELGASGRIAHEQLAVSSLEEEVGIAARQEPHACRPAIDRRAERLLVFRQDPPLAGGRVHGCQRCRERSERGSTPRRLDPSPLCERLRCRRSEDVEVPARRARVERRPDQPRAGALSRSSAAARHPIASALGRWARRSATTRGGGRARAPLRGSPSGDPRETLRSDRRAAASHGERQDHPAGARR